MQKLGDKKIQIIRQNGKGVSEPLTAKKGFDLSSFFVSAGIAVREKTGANVLGPTKVAPLAAPRANLTAVKTWVGMEERVVHDYQEQKAPLLKPASFLMKTPAKQPLPGLSNSNDQKRKVLLPLATKKGRAFWDFFGSPKSGSHGKSGADLLPKSPSFATPRADLNKVRNWVAMEEKIVHAYKKQKAVLPRHVVRLPQSPAKRHLPAFETFSTQTTVSLPPGFPGLKEPLRVSKKTSLGVGGFFLALGWLAAGVLVFLYLQGALSNRDASERFQAERDRLKRSYAELKNASENQGEEMKWLASRLRDSEGDLKTLRENKAEFSRNLEKKYREELMRITVRYETELDNLRATVQTKDAVVDALKAQVQALEKILDQIRMSAVSGGVAGFFRLPTSDAGVFALQGKITAINGRQGFFVMNIGADQGARSGQRVTVSRDGIRLATGRIDRVYPTMSAVAVHDKNILSLIQEGDTVSFSN